MRTVLSSLLALVAAAVAFGCTAKGAPSTCTNDWCVKDPLSCWCSGADAGKCESMGSATTPNRWTSSYWLTREECGTRLQFHWFDGTGPHRDVYDLAGNLVGHVDYTDTTMCNQKVYGEAASESCGSCVLLKGNPNAMSWPPPTNCPIAKDSGIDAAPDGF